MYYKDCTLYYKDLTLYYKDCTLYIVVYGLNKGGWEDEQMWQNSALPEGSPLPPRYSWPHDKGLLSS